MSDVDFYQELVKAAAARGARKPAIVTCRQCGGEGWVNDANTFGLPSTMAKFRPVSCPSCGGRGRVEVKPQ